MSRNLVEALIARDLADRVLRESPDRATAVGRLYGALVLELIEYLVEGGDDWNRRRGNAPPSRESATAFVNAGWAPSFVLVAR